MEQSFVPDPAPLGPSAGNDRHEVEIQAIMDAVMTAIHQSGMRSDTLDTNQQWALWKAATELPHGAAPAQARQEQIHHTLSVIQQQQRMAALNSLRQAESRSVDPRGFAHPGVGMYDRPPDINASHSNPPWSGWYLERQPQTDESSGAQYAVNAMVGQRFVSLADFARAEAVRRGEATAGAVKAIEREMLVRSVPPVTVQAALEARGFHTSLYRAEADLDERGYFVLSMEQARWLDQLPTERLLLQSEVRHNNIGKFRYVAFRRNGEQWILLNSLYDAPRPGISPSRFLLESEATTFTAVWPRQLL